MATRAHSYADTARAAQHQIGMGSVLNVLRKLSCSLPAVGPHDVRFLGRCKFRSRQLAPLPLPATPPEHSAGAAPPPTSACSEAWSNREPRQFWLCCSTPVRANKSRLRCMPNIPDLSAMSVPCSGHCSAQAAAQRLARPPLQGQWAADGRTAAHAAASRRLHSTVLSKTGWLTARSAKHKEQKQLTNVHTPRHCTMHGLRGRARCS